VAVPAVGLVSSPNGTNPAYVLVGNGAPPGTTVSVFPPMYLEVGPGGGAYGGLFVPSMKSAGGFDATAYNPAGAYANPTTVSIPFLCPPSAVLTILLKFVVFSSAGVVATDFIAGSIQVRNNTTASTVFAASDNRSAQLNGQAIGAVGTNATTLSYNVTASALGSMGDSLTITPQFRQAVAGRYTISKTELSVIPSL
jgi:hypothetical protein